MTDCAEKFLKAAIKVVYECITDYVGHIASCDTNLVNLRKKLKEVLRKKDDIDEKVERGKAEVRKITRTAASWLKDVRILTEDAELRWLMKKDVETAKYVVNLMEKDALKDLVRENIEMQKLVLKVMKRLKKEVDKAPKEDHMKKFTEGDYTRVIEVVVEVLKDTTEEFKMLMKNDPKVAEIATKMLKDKDLEKLTKDDKELKKIVNDAQKLSSDDDEEEVSRNNNEDEGSRVKAFKGRPLDEDEKEEAAPSKGDIATVDKNTLREAAKKLVTPLDHLLTGLRKLTVDENFKSAVPEAESATLLVDVIDGLVVRGGWLNTDEDDDNDSESAQQMCCGCAPNISASYFHNRYKLSLAAENMAKHIQNDILVATYPGDQVTESTRQKDLKDIPTESTTKGLASRDALVKKILKKLIVDEVDVVGIYGMGGTGKTILAKDVLLRYTNKFDKKVVVDVLAEVSNALDIKRIQKIIAESIDLPLHDLDDVVQRAKKLYNSLISQKDKRILIILDNIWYKLNTREKVGIPPNCKLILTTRDKEVCRDMGVQDANIFRVDVLNEIESIYFFERHVGNKVNDRKIRTVVDRLLSKCEGLPLAIVAIANMLKNKDLLSWSEFANQLSKPISSQIDGVKNNTYMIMEKSFTFVESEEKKLFFLLACLSPPSSSVLIEDLMRFGIGLDLFQHVDNLSEAMKQATTWAEELVSSSILLDCHSRKHVQIHDVTRASGVFFASKVKGHKFMVDSIPRWKNKDTIRHYTGISLQSGNDYSPLNKVKAHKLQILLLKGGQSTDFDDSFFEEMTNLKVLSLSNMSFRTKLPESMRKLKKLRALHLEGCTLGDIKAIGELVNLFVLSLRKSFCSEGLPNKLEELCNLRLLDLTACSCKNVIPLIPDGVLGRLTKLEGLYMLDSCSVASTTELQMLHYLNILEMRMPALTRFSLNGQFLKNLDRYRITMGDSELHDDLSQFHRVLSCRRNDMSDESVSCFKVLCSNAHWLRIEDIDLRATLVPDLDDEGFRDLVCLDVSYCNNLFHIVKVDGTNNFVLAFPHLESLKLSELQCLRSLCDEEAPTGMFPNLQHLSVSQTLSLEYIMPLSLAPRKLSDFSVSGCQDVKFFFLESCAAAETSYGKPGVKDETSVIVLPSLRSLELETVGCQSFSGINTGNILEGHQVFFNKKVDFPSLDVISMVRCPNITKLWSTDAGFCGFKNLTKIYLEYCDELSSIGPPAVFNALENLENLRISDCCNMLQVITKETNEPEANDRMIVFRKLKVLEIVEASSLECFYEGEWQIDFPCLQELRLCHVSSMNRFVGSDNSSAVFFHGQIEFKFLEDLALSYVSDEVKGLCNWHPLPEEEVNVTSVMLNPVPKLRRLQLGEREALWLMPPMICKNLSSLELGSFDDEPSDIPSLEEEKFRWKSSELPNLNKLGIAHCELELFDKNDLRVDTPAATFSGQLKELQLKSLPKLDLIPLHLFKGLCSLYLDSLNWEYLISADALQRVQGSLQQLEVLDISSCEKLRVIIENDVEPHADLVFEFSRLKEFKISYSGAFIKFSSIQKAKLVLPRLESLKIYSCDKFQQFWSGHFKAPKLEHVGLQSCKEMETLVSSEQNDMLDLSSLQVLIADLCPKLRSLSSGPLVAPKLHQVTVRNCKNMQRFSLGHPNKNDVVELRHLKELEIEGCDDMQSFSNRPVKAPNLTKVVMKNCPQMQWVLSEDTIHNASTKVELPLEKVEIYNCLKLESFCSGLLRAPNLTHIMHNNCKYSALEIEDLNKILTEKKC